MREFVARQEASERGLTNFFTGQPCRNGHVSERRARSGHCIACVEDAKTTFRERLGPEGVKAKQKEYDERYLHNDPGRKRANSRRAQFRMLERDPEYHRRKAREWRENNAELALAKSRAYHEFLKRERPTLLKIRIAASNAKRRVVAGAHRTSEIMRAIGEAWDRSGGKCELCGSTDRLELDHIAPVSQGGDNRASNLQFLCFAHNRSKRASGYLEWLDRITSPQEIAA